MQKPQKEVFQSESHEKVKETFEEEAQREDQEEILQSQQEKPRKTGQIVRTRNYNNQQQQQSQGRNQNREILQSQEKINKYQQKINQQFELLQNLLQSQLQTESEENPQGETREQMQQEILNYALEQQQNDLRQQEANREKQTLKVYRLSQEGKPVTQNLYLEQLKELQTKQEKTQVSQKSQWKNQIEQVQEEDYLLDELQYLLLENNQIQKELLLVDQKMTSLQQNQLSKSFSNFNSEIEQQIWDGIGKDYLFQKESWHQVENYETTNRELDSAFDQREQKIRQMNSYIKDLNKKKSSPNLFNQVSSTPKNQSESMYTTLENFNTQKQQVDQYQKEKDLSELQIRNKIFQFKVRRDVLYRTYTDK